MFVLLAFVSFLLVTLTAGTDEKYNLRFVNNTVSATSITRDQIMQRAQVWVDKKFPTHKLQLLMDTDKIVRVM